MPRAAPLHAQLGTLGMNDKIAWTVLLARSRMPKYLQIQVNPVNSVYFGLTCSQATAAQAHILGMHLPQQMRRDQDCHTVT